MRMPVPCSSAVSSGLSLLVQRLAARPVACDTDGRGRETWSPATAGVLGSLRLASGWLRDLVDRSGPSLDLAVLPSPSSVGFLEQKLLGCGSVTRAALGVAPEPCCDTVEALERLVARRRSLRSLSFAVDDADPSALHVAARVLEAAAASLGGLAALRIDGSSELFGSELGARAAEAIGRMTGLKSLDVGADFAEALDGETDRAVAAALEAALAPLTSLRELDVRSCGRGGPWGAVSRMLRRQRLPHLEQLRVGCTIPIFNHSFTCSSK
jgi:hypothetical protein